MRGRRAWLGVSCALSGCGPWTLEHEAALGLLERLGEAGLRCVANAREAPLYPACALSEVGPWGSLEPGGQVEARWGLVYELRDGVSLRGGLPEPGALAVLRVGGGEAMLLEPAGGDVARAEALREVVRAALRLGQPGPPVEADPTGSHPEPSAWRVYATEDPDFGDVWVLVARERGRMRLGLFPAAR